MTYKRMMAGLAFTVAASAVSAQENTLQMTGIFPENIYNFAETQTQLYAFHDAELNGGRLIVNRARKDDAMGIVCEWKIHGIIGRGDKGKISIDNVTLLYSQCAAASEEPKAWQRARRVEAVTIMDMDIHAPVQDSLNRSIVREGYESLAKKTGVVSRYLRSWNISTEEVCLETAEGFYDSNMDFKPYFEKKWGCFPITNKDYFEKVTSYIGLHAT